MATKFTAEFLETRMAAHRRLIHDLEDEYVNEIIDEVQELPKRKPKMGRLFPLLAGVEAPNTRAGERVQ